MRNILLTVTFLLVLVAAAYSLQCYTCFEVGKESEQDTVCSKTELDDNEAKYVITCPSGLDTCQRVHGTALDIHAVTMTCTTKSACEEAKEKCEDSGDDCGVACCTTDKCNAGSSVSFSVFLMAVSSLLGLALLK
ncbi:hypothetical protein ACROYT_G007755 [Oculina patagonica]